MEFRQLIHKEFQSAAGRPPLATLAKGRKFVPYGVIGPQPNPAKLACRLGMSSFSGLRYIRWFDCKTPPLTTPNAPPLLTWPQPPNCDSRPPSDFWNCLVHRVELPHQGLTSKKLAELKSNRIWLFWNQQGAFGGLSAPHPQGPISCLLGKSPLDPSKKILLKKFCVF